MLTKITPKWFLQQQKGQIQILAVKLTCEKWLSMADQILHQSGVGTTVDGWLVGGQIEAWECLGEARSQRYKQREGSYNHRG